MVDVVVVEDVLIVMVVVVRWVSRVGCFVIHAEYRTCLGLYRVFTRKTCEWGRQ